MILKIILCILSVLLILSEPKPHGGTPSVADGIWRMPP